MIILDMLGDKFHNRMMSIVNQLFLIRLSKVKIQNVLMFLVMSR